MRGKIDFKEFCQASGKSMENLHKVELLTPDIHKLYEQFVDMDSDSNGHVTKHEAIQSIWAGSRCPIDAGDMMSLIGETMFAGLDLNRDGKVSFAEFVQAALNGNFVGGDPQVTQGPALLKAPGAASAHTGRGHHLRHEVTGAT